MNESLYPRISPRPARAAVIENRSNSIRLAGYMALMFFINVPIAAFGAVMLLYREGRKSLRGISPQRR